MGGLGSGRRGGTGRTVAEECRSIDVNRLYRDGCLNDGWAGLWQWTRNGEQVGSVYLQVENDRLRLTYRQRYGEGPWEDVKESVPLTYAACNFGGYRPYLICPGAVNGVACARRVAKLYAAGRYFLCRHCYRLAHASQRENATDRVLRAADKIRRRLGGEPGMAARFPARPKGMWRRTYDRLCRRAFDAEMTADEAITLRVERLLERIESPRQKRSFWR